MYDITSDQIGGCNSEVAAVLCDYIAPNQYVHVCVVACVLNS